MLRMIYYVMSTILKDFDGGKIARDRTNDGVRLKAEIMGPDPRFRLI